MEQDYSETTNAELEQEDIHSLSVNTIRFLAVDGVQKANSGHPGMPMGMAAAAYTLWTRHLRHNPGDPDWANRDRFVLSAGHGSMLLYSLMHLTGYESMPMEELKNFRQWGSVTPGHPEHFLTRGVETTTGPLGQGISNAVGMAMAERYCAAHFNRDGLSLIDHFTYCICSDGDLMEGVSHETASLAGHLGLGKLICLYDDNSISIDGSTELAFTEDVCARFEAYGWHVSRVADGNDVGAVDAAIRAAKEQSNRPSLIAVRTHIGFGSPNKQDTAEVHGSPLGDDEVVLTKRNLGWPEDKTFFVPKRVLEHMRGAGRKGAAAQETWNELFERYAGAHPDEAGELKTWVADELPDGWEAALPVFEAGAKLATRAASGKVLAAVGPTMPRLIGGSADLTPSNNTMIPGRSDFQKDNPSGGYLRFGVREHGMGSICNGLVLHHLRPYCATFLIFSDYMRAAIRLSALGRLPVIYIFTHDSIGLGEDGPTHQPVEHLMALRAIPNLTVIRPADANETSEAWRAALLNTGGPTAMALTRQGLPTLDRSTMAAASGVQKGGYVLTDSEGDPEVILIGTGSELQLAVDAANTLREGGIATRVVSMPSWELFDGQPLEYRESVLPPDVTRRISIEAGITMGWERYVGLAGRSIGLDRFGASAPGGVNFKQFGFTAERIVEETRRLF